VYVSKTTSRIAAAAVPQQLDSVPTRVLETDEIKAFAGLSGDDHKTAFSLPVPMGVSTGNSNGTFAGTMGGRVFRIGRSKPWGTLRTTMWPPPQAQASARHN
jgi:hypothetical protein